MDGNPEVPLIQQPILPNTETKETTLQDQRNFTFIVDATSRLDYLPADVTNKIKEFIEDHSDNFNIQIQVNGDKVSILNQSEGTWYILDKTEHIEENFEGEKVLVTSPNILEVEPGASIAIDNRLSDYSVHFGSKKSVESYDPLSPNYRIPLIDVFCLAQNTPLDDIKIKPSSWVKFKERLSGTDEYSRRRYQVEMNRVIRSQRVFMERADIPKKSIDKYEESLLNGEMEIVHLNSAGKYDSQKGVMQFGYDPKLFHRNYKGVSKIIAHEAVHYDPKKSFFIKEFESAIKKCSNLFEEPADLPARAALEGFTEFITHLIDDEPVEHSDYKDISYSDAVAVARDIYLTIAQKKVKNMPT
ncbi:hypothetical protein A3A93_00305 [Candidatus Roizmanbacteria bacterium RIFCSPLOWO2_01_FULL_38_12]|uniref:Uncharacterized protein n=1 Tax=Candidatus Roizmanbacteria bacterium RIFCSPLOWO2_01_FULL_38_12 TaxID=1802061 RepID=A0A1F7IUF3_9BACT|nr:MAG: hypothetical protein A2861_00860 [Candidatus Roizmanbacteria bacterium RIFCSPHIGHO2_01_FULL_38_15]OGK34707.1 MAG: hypothetical protein A3F59_01125 [Candidatus Roizmanbacteria bacterium RIFCSPHIGHO2_12_FULL_38_13]OGK46983.1 MAG: hypothetical protein A3A93_00305 [Candidatus Roizmanbacteria bacterium RIFCSPLOWO2_01_FULL_38_12]